MEDKNTHKTSWPRAILTGMVKGISLLPVFVLCWILANSLIALSALGICELLKLTLG